LSPHPTIPTIDTVFFEKLPGQDYVLAQPTEDKFTTYAEFDAITIYLQPPEPDEEFNIALGRSKNQLDRSHP
jgi:hypothetical protein